ncbi:hypothetical protein [Amycolatopsis speibonae]|uniref:Uncharacterized protein n=1 Tax=Amycolatopsis speibonae TaxID=1450224 RepID=A0ABV7P4G1_9PSEU
MAKLDDEAQQEREVRLITQRILAKHLKPGGVSTRPAKTFWKGIDLDLTGATLIKLDLLGCQINTARSTERPSKAARSSTKRHFLTDVLACPRKPPLLPSSVGLSAEPDVVNGAGSGELQ